MKLKESIQIEFPEVRVEDILQRLKNVKKSGSGWTAICPCHNDHRNSFSISKGDNGKPLIHCHACQCDYEDVLRTLGLWFELEEEPTDSRVIAEYDYVDEEGELVYQVVKLKPKGYAQRRLDKDGKWVYNLKGVVRVLYNLPNLLEAEQVIVVEGEKDADNLNNIGFTATTNSSGAGKWLKEYNKYFKGKDVVIIPDNDSVGFAHAEEVAKNVYPTANSVKIIYLDGLEEKQDVSDWLKSHDNNDLGHLIDFTEPVVYEESELNFDETSPRSEESEKALIGAVLKEGHLMSKVIKSHVVDDIYNPKHVKILKAMIDCFTNRDRVDLVLVSDKLKTSRHLEMVGGTAYLQELIANAPNSINLDRWIKLLASKSDLRKLVATSSRLKKVAANELDNADNLILEINAEINNIRRRSKPKSFFSASEIAEQVVEDVKNITGGMVGLSTGYPDIDSLTSGLQKADITIIAGRPSMGKTALALNIGYNVAQNSNNVLVFSLEMSKEQLLGRLISSESRVNNKKLRNNTLTEDEWFRVANTLPLIEGYNLHIDDTPAISVIEIRAKIIEYIEEYGSLDLVIIDYLQLMSGSGKNENRQQEVSRISRELKGLAKEFGIPFIVLSQLSRAPESRSDNRPMMSDLRESGSIEQDADVVAFVYRHHYYTKNPDDEGLAEIIYAKQRNGEAETVKLAFIGKYTKFESLIKI